MPGKIFLPLLVQNHHDLSKERKIQMHGLISIDIPCSSSKTLIIQI
jgi:hypothetical protein